MCRDVRDIGLDLTWQLGIILWIGSVPHALNSFLEISSSGLLFQYERMKPYEFCTPMERSFCWGIFAPAQRPVTKRLVTWVRVRVGKGLRRG